MAIKDKFIEEINTAIDEGKIVEQNSPDKFFNNPENPRLKDFLSKVL